MKDALKTGQVLGRNDMKKIMAGSGSSTNCQLCENGDIIYRDYDGSEPEDGCSWSTCPQIHP